MLAGTIAAPSAYDPGPLSRQGGTAAGLRAESARGVGLADLDAIAAARSAYVRVEAPPSAFVAPHFAFRVEEELASRLSRPADRRLPHRHDLWIRRSNPPRKKALCDDWRSCRNAMSITPPRWSSIRATATFSPMSAARIF